MRTALRAIGVAAGMLVAVEAAAQITFYQGEGFRGRVFATSHPVDNFARVGFNDLASSAVVERGRWEVCEHAFYEGRCVVLSPGSYASLAGMGMNNSISSVRRIVRDVTYENHAPPPLPAPTYAYRQLPSERLFVANVTSVRAVVGPPEQRCWIERQQVVEDRRANVPGAILGGLLGGVLGHQIGGGRGRDVATVGGAVAGVAIGANAGGGGPVYGQNVQRCTNVPSSTRPEFWDVTYDFGGQEHRVQLGAPPGPTITVNEKGEPRG